MLGITYLADIVGLLTLVAGMAQLWPLPFLIYLNAVDTAKVNRWVIYAVTSLLLSYPNGESPCPFSDTSLARADGNNSTSDPGGMELTELEHCPVPHRFCGLLQHVCPNKRHNRFQHLPSW
jgi:hypothetical protein